MKDFHEYGLEVGFLTFPHNFLVNTFYTYMQRRVVNSDQTKGNEFGDKLSVTATKGEKNSILKLSAVVVNLVLGKNSFFFLILWKALMCILFLQKSSCKLLWSDLG